MNYKQNAREKMKGFCRVCPVCDGRVCSGEVPGMGGLGSGASFRANVEALASLRLNMRCIHAAKQPDLSTRVLGFDLSMPVMAAPIGGVAYNMGDQAGSEEEYIHAIIHGCKAEGIVGCGGDGVPDPIHELAFAAIKAADNFGIPFIKPWDSDELARKLDKALSHGFPVIGMDVDAAGLITLRKQGRPVSPKTPAEIRSLADHIHKHNALFVIKGVMDTEDALLLMDAGVDGIVVSNHGGRVLDHTPGTAEVLPRIVTAVAGRIPILVDGGVRTGADILKMLALGAQAVLIGRPYSVAAVGNGCEGVQQYTATLRAELTQAMTLTACPSISAITSRILA